MSNPFDTDFDRASSFERRDDFSAKSRRFFRYLSTRQAETWIFFAAGVLIGKIFF